MVRNSVLVKVTALFIILLCYSAVVYANEEQSKLPDINENVSPVQMEDGWETTAGQNLLLILYCYDGIPSIYRNGKILYARDSYLTKEKSKTVRVCTYQLRKGDYCTMSKQDSGDRIAGCYATCEGSLASGRAFIGSYVFSEVDPTSYFKVKVSGNGIIKLTVKGHFHNDSVYKVRLYNSKKESLSKGWEPLYGNNLNTTVFGVRRGTYYVGIRPYGLPTDDALFDIKETVSKKSVSPAGSSQKKAKPIILGQGKKGILYIGEQNCNWYKLKLKKPRKVRIIASSQLGLGGSRLDTFKYQIKGSGASNLGKGYYKLKKGTYYVKVSRTGAANGFFSIKLARV